MSTRGELELALVKTQAEWSSAYLALDKAQTKRAKADAEWEKVLTDRRKASTDRRKSTSRWDQTVPDRRKASSDRRVADTDIAVFAKKVSDQHEAFLAQSGAETEYLAAEARLETAAAERDRIVSALAELNRAQKMR